MNLARSAILFALASVLAAPLAVVAQQPGKVYRIGYLSYALPPTAKPPTALREGLKEFGYVEGKNLVIDFRGANGNGDRLPELVAELIRGKPDVILATNTPAAQAAQKATSNIPVIFMTVADPVASGLVTSLGRPGGNVTGFTTAAPELSAKRLQLLKEAVPTVSRVAVLSNPANPASALQLHEMEAVAKSLGVKLQVAPAKDPAEFENAFALMVKEHANALIVAADPVFAFHRAKITELAAKHRLPAIYQNSLDAESGGLLAYGPSGENVNRRAAVFIDRILKGAKAAELPVEQPSTFQLIINRKTANALGLKIPPSLLLRADRVIE